jgi:hypothetical protein
METVKITVKYALKLNNKEYNFVLINNKIVAKYLNWTDALEEAAKIQYYLNLSSIKNTLTAKNIIRKD